MTKTTKNEILRHRGLAVAVLAATVWVLAGGGTAAPVHAQALPPTFDLSETRIQKAPGVFKFQARLSQAKMPVGDVDFDRIIVNVLGGGAAVCQEVLPNVRVQDGVLNLEIGRTASCQLDEVIAVNSTLEFQICLNAESCLQPIALSTVPYAVKSTYAHQAQEAYTAQRSVESEFAHFMPADSDLRTSQTLGRGYYDFHSPTNAAQLSALAINPTSVQDQVNDGYIQWTPVKDSGNNRLHISGRDGENLQELSELIMHAGLTQVLGQLYVAEGARVVGDSSITSGENQVVVTASGTSLAGSVDFTKVTTVTGLTADKIQDLGAITINPNQIVSIDASKIQTGVIGIDRIPSLPASKITGSLSVSQVPNLPASKITGSLSTEQVPSLPASKITGSLSTEQVPNLPASKITSGTLTADRVPQLDVTKIDMRWRTFTVVGGTLIVSNARLCIPWSAHYCVVAPRVINTTGETLNTSWRVDDNNGRACSVSCTGSGMTSSFTPIQ